MSLITMPGNLGIFFCTKDRETRSCFKKCLMLSLSQMKLYPMILVDHIFRQIEQLGYLVAELRQDGYRVLIAEPMVNIDPDKRGPDRFRQMVRIDGVNETSRNQAARQLALQCGIIISDSGK